MEALARISAKGQVTVPESIRDSLGWVEGDTLVFRVDGDHAVLALVPDLPDLLDLAVLSGCPTTLAA
jgi:AbrB family looped-hinge helix DNA binding protein